MAKKHVQYINTINAAGENQEVLQGLQEANTISIFNSAVTKLRPRSQKLLLLSLATFMSIQCLVMLDITCLAELYLSTT